MAVTFCGWWQDVWRRTIDGAWIPRKTNVENFICHNGDLVFGIYDYTYTDTRQMQY